MKQLIISSLTVSSLLLVGCGSTPDEGSRKTSGHNEGNSTTNTMTTKAYFGDKSNNHLIV